MDRTKRLPGDKVLQELEQSIARTVGRVPAALQEVARRSADARSDHAQALEAARERISAGARHAPRRFRL